MHTHGHLGSDSASKDQKILFFFVGIEANSATLSKNTTSGTQKKQTAAAPPALIDSIKSNSATVAHFKVDLSQYFDIFKNNACHLCSSREMPPLSKREKEKER